jgi:hypothetical protein
MRGSVRRAATMGTLPFPSLQVPHPDTLLLAALRIAPRRYRMPSLPADAAAAKAEGIDSALAFAIEHARLAREAGSPAPLEVRDLFISALAGLIRQALAPQGGDPAFQALVLRARADEVEEHVRLSAHAAADRRAVRAAVDAIAHPGKLRGVAAGSRRDALSQLHHLASSADWTQVRRVTSALLEQASAGQDSLRAQLQAIVASPALARLERGDALLQGDTVQRYQALCAQRGPLAGSDAAAAQGRAAAQAGGVAEDSTVDAFGAVAGLLTRYAGGSDSYRVVRSLRTPRGFPGLADKAKDEWDAAIVRSTGAGGADIVLLAEVKAAPAAATPDFSRLLRGLQRLAQASDDMDYAFVSADGEVRVPGAALRRLQPRGATLPPHVIYCCSAPAEAQVQVLSAASKAVLLAEPASVAFAQQLAPGSAPREADLLPVWEALTTAPRLRSALHQYDTARVVREAMLHPDDLLAAVSRALANARAS